MMRPKGLMETVVLSFRLGPTVNLFRGVGTHPGKDLDIKDTMTWLFGFSVEMMPPTSNEYQY